MQNQALTPSQLRRIRRAGLVILLAASVMPFPVQACTFCNKEIVLSHVQLACGAERIDTWIAEAEVADPVFTDFAECDGVGTPSGGAGGAYRDPRIPRIPEANGEPDPPAGPPATYFLSRVQLLCLRDRLDGLFEADEPVHFVFASCDETDG